MAKAQPIPAYLKGRKGQAKAPTERAPERAQPRFAIGPDATMTGAKPFLGAKKGGKIGRK